MPFGILALAALGRSVVYSQPFGLLPIEFVWQRTPAVGADLEGMRLWLTPLAAGRGALLKLVAEVGFEPTTNGI